MSKGVGLELVLTVAIGSIFALMGIGAILQFTSGTAEGSSLSSGAEQISNIKEQADFVCRSAPQQGEVYVDLEEGQTIEIVGDEAKLILKNQGGEEIDSVEMNDCNVLQGNDITVSGRFRLIELENENGVEITR